MEKNLLKFVEDPMDLYKEAFLAMKNSDYAKSQDDLTVFKTLGIDMDFLVENGLVYMYQMAKQNFKAVNL